MNNVSKTKTCFLLTQTHKIIMLLAIFVLKQKKIHLKSEKLHKHLEFCEEEKWKVKMNLQSEILRKVLTVSPSRLDNRSTISPNPFFNDSWYSFWSVEISLAFKPRASLQACTNSIKTSFSFFTLSAGCFSTLPGARKASAYAKGPAFTWLKKYPLHIIIWIVWIWPHWFLNKA